jgi:hypothetical protein
MYKIEYNNEYRRNREFAHDFVQYHVARATLECGRVWMNQMCPTNRNFRFFTVYFFWRDPYDDIRYITRNPRRDGNNEVGLESSMCVVSTPNDNTILCNHMLEHCNKLQQHKSQMNTFRMSKLRLGLIGYCNVFLEITNTGESTLHQAFIIAESNMFFASPNHYAQLQQLVVKRSLVISDANKALKLHERFRKSFVENNPDPLRYKTIHSP